jgi:hypothetical protein
MTRFFPAVAALLLTAPLAPAAGALSVEQLTTNGRTNPLGIAADDISFGWAIVAEARGVVQSAYHTRMMAEMAAGLGEAEQAAEWTALVPKIRAAFAAAYCQSDGSLYTGTQTVYAMALGMDLIPDPALRERVTAKFVEKLAADNYHLRTGFLGTPWLLPALTAIGRNDLAMRLLLNMTIPRGASRFAWARPRCGNAGISSAPTANLVPWT